MPDVDVPRLDQLLRAVHALEPLIRAHADEAEQNRRLSPVVVTALAEAGIFRMYTPRALGGLEVDPLTFYRVVEAIARIDGSTGWCVFIGGGNPLLGAFLADEAAEKIFGSDPQVITAGVVHPYGAAVVSDGGYRVTGRWSYASGCQHSSWIFCCCQVFDGDQLRLTDDGQPDVRLFFVPSGLVSIVDTWEVSGLAGTGSHDVVIDQVFVPSAYTCAFKPGITPRCTRYQSPVYRYVLYASFALPIGAVALGIAQGAMDTCLELAQSKKPSVGTEMLRDRPLFQVRLAEAVALVRAARAWLHAAVRQTWQSHLANGQVSFDERADLLLAAANATRSAAAAVDILYTAAGASANYRRSPLQRALRDVHAATQHVGTAAPQFESAGRMLLGLPPLQSLILI
jgi:alkylation response protein AidB-like acyl-CoA dehydrogenase